MINEHFETIVLQTIDSAKKKLGIGSIPNEELKLVQVLQITGTISAVIDPYNKTITEKDEDDGEDIILHTYSILGLYVFIFVLTIGFPNLMEQLGSEVGNEQKKDLENVLETFRNCNKLINENSD